MLGSTVNISPLDGSLNPTGQVFSTQTADDLGQFSVQFMASGRVALEGNGFYYNEVTGVLSNAQLTLRAIYDVQADGPQKAYINLVTHLSFQRVKALISGGLDTAAAIRQAEGELRTALGLGATLPAVSQRGTELNILGGDSDGNAYLLALSGLFAQAASDRAVERGAAIDPTLQELLNTTAVDLADDGQLGPALRQAYVDAQAHLDVEAVVAALRTRLQNIGSTAAVPDLARFIDSDGDGVSNANDNCPYAANANQAPVADGLCRWSVQATKLSMPAMSTTLYPVDISGNKKYGVFGTLPSNGFFLMKNNGSGALAAAPAVNLGVPSGGSASVSIGNLTVTDMNNDGYDDIVRVNLQGWLAVYPGDGQGGFGAPVAINKLPPLTADMVDGVAFSTLSLSVVGDFKKDGLPDLFGVVQGNTGFKLVLVNQGAGGTWGTPTVVGSSPVNYMVAADLDSDGKQDVVFVDSFLNGARLYFAKSDGSGGFTLTNPTSLPSQVQGSQLVVADT